MRRIHLFVLAVVFVILSTVMGSRYKTFASPDATTPLLYTTLNSLASVTTPQNGSGTGASVKTVPTNNFVPAHVGNGINIDASGEYVRFLQISGSVKNIELTRGTINFWYRPTYVPTDGLRHDIFATGSNDQAGYISLIKRPTAGNNDLWLRMIDSNLVEHSFSVPINSYSWVANSWVNVRFTWNTTAFGQPVFKLYLNGQNLTPRSGEPIGPLTMPAESSTKYIFIGASSGSTTGAVANGIIDEFSVYDQVIPPGTQASPSPTPSATPSPSPSVTPTPTPSQRPNIVLIVSDDQRFGTMSFMPKIIAKLEAESVRFQKAFATTPTCCPSRSTMLTGQYSHNHGVLENEAPTGGVTIFNPDSTLPIWLSEAGYRTGIFGKYLNGYGCLDNTIPPGWDDWQVFNKCQRNQYFNYSLNSNGNTVSYGTQATQYSTRVLADKAVSFINSTPANEPVFVYFTPYGPHEPSIPDPLDAYAWPSLTYTKSPSFNEADVSDKPDWVRALTPLDSTLITKSNTRYKNIAKTLLSVDRAVEKVVNTLSATGRLDNTMIIYIGDNGLSLGEHRWFLHDGDEYGAKECIYEECIKIPLWIRLPEKISRQETHLVGNIDIAPTILDMADVTPPTLVNGEPIDGVSLIPLITNPNTAWRDGILIEMLGNTPELNFSAIRTDQYIYGEYQNGNKELYNLSTDPYQLQNLCPASAGYSCGSYASIAADLQARLQQLRD